MGKLTMYSIVLLVLFSSCKLKLAGIKASKELAKTDITRKTNNECHILLKNNSKIIFDCNSNPEASDYDAYATSIEINGSKVELKKIAYIKSNSSIKLLKKRKKLIRGEYFLNNNTNKLHIYSQLLGYSMGKEGRKQYSSYHDFLVLDPKTGKFGSIEDYNFIAPLVRDNPNCTQYLKQYKRKRAARYVHRFASIGALVGAFVHGSSKKVKSVETKDYSLELGGAVFFNWLLGGMYRKRNNSLPLILAVEEYNK